MSFRTSINRWLLLIVALVPLAGCGTGIVDSLSALNRLALNITDAVNAIQSEDPHSIVITGASGRGDTVILQQNTTVIVDIQNQLVIEELPDITLLGIENLTSFDIYVRYAVNGVVQGVFVLQGDTLLLEYPCLDDIELLTEDDFDIFTGDFVDSFDLSILLLNPEDFICGEAVITSIDDSGVATDFETIDLTP